MIYKLSKNLFNTWQVNQDIGLASLVAWLNISYYFHGRNVT